MSTKLRQKVSIDNLVREQEKAASKVSLRTVNLQRIRKICGVDVSYSKGKSISCAAVWDRATQRIVETSLHHSAEDFPYIPSFLYKREYPKMVEAVRQLRSIPDLLLVDGHGIAHPRRAGLAVFVGLSLELPTVGVAKSLLTGKIVKSLGIFSPIFLQGKEVGYLVLKEGSRKYYLSPGHLVRVEDLPLLASLWNYEYPSVLRYADKLSRGEASRR